MTKTKIDFADVRGQEAVKRGLMIALAGKHSVILIGPPGWGKSMLAERVRAMDDDEDIIIHEITYEPGGAIPCLPVADILLQVPPVPFRELTGKMKGTSTSDIHKIVAAAGKTRDSNLSDSCLLLMKQAMSELQMNGRDYAAAVHVAGTIARLDGAVKISEMHLAEAIQYCTPKAK